MSKAGILTRVRNRVLRTSGYICNKRLLEREISEPIVSFTFDDFPRSALYEGGAILKRYGGAGTYFACAGLMGKVEPSGEMFVEDDLRVLVEQGHELGCHTCWHNDAMLTWPGEFERSILANREALARMCPGVEIRTFSYPKAEPNAATKRAASRHALCCRAGGQTLNRGRSDLNCLRSFFVEQSREVPERMKELIDENSMSRGWLIFSTHEVCESPGPYGCTIELFEEIVRRAAQSGARLLTMGQACDALLAAPPVAADRVEERV